MSNFQSVDMSPSDFSADDLATLQQQLEDQQADKKAGTFDGIKITTAAVHTSTMKDGQFSTETVNKGFGPNGGTAYANATLRPGHVVIPGVGETTIDAAKAGGLLPQSYREGDPLPFDNAPKAAAEGNPKGAQADDKANAAADTDTDVDDSPAAHRAKVASDILTGVDQAHGQHVTDGLLNHAVENGGDPETVLDMLPEGVSEVQAKQVYAGYMAQAENTLAERAPSASIAMMSEVLSEDQLRAARMAVVNGDTDGFVSIANAAVDHLANMPKLDPEGFKAMLEDMPADERKALRYDRLSNDWRVTIPGQPEMSFGAAVRMGLVRV
ncbi:hypothetical protein KUV28_15060 [Ferrimonas balearica]|nr:hypothetical protein [Ferrimonas balearica]